MPDLESTFPEHVGNQHPGRRFVVEVLVMGCGLFLVQCCFAWPTAFSWDTFVPSFIGACVLKILFRPQYKQTTTLGLPGITAKKLQ